MHTAVHIAEYVNGKIRLDVMAVKPAPERCFGVNVVKRSAASKKALSIVDSVLNCLVPNSNCCSVIPDTVTARHRDLQNWNNGNDVYEKSGNQSQKEVKEL